MNLILAQVACSVILTLSNTSPANQEKTGLAISADLGPVYALNTGRWGVAVNAYPGIRLRHGWEPQLILGYHRSPLRRIASFGFCDVTSTGTTAACVGSTYETVMVDRAIFGLGVKYDFATLFGTEAWHPFFAAHVGIALATGVGDLLTHAVAGVDRAVGAHSAFGLSLQHSWSGSSPAGWLALACDASYRF